MAEGEIELEGSLAKLKHKASAFASSWNTRLSGKKSALALTYRDSEKSKNVKGWVYLSEVQSVRKISSVDNCMVGPSATVQPQPKLVSAIGDHEGRVFEIRALSRLFVVRAVDRHVDEWVEPLQRLCNLAREEEGVRGQPVTGGEGASSHGAAAWRPLLTIPCAGAGASIPAARVRLQAAGEAAPSQPGRPIQVEGGSTGGSTAGSRAMHSDAEEGMDGEVFDDEGDGTREGARGDKLPRSHQRRFSDSSVDSRSVSPGSRGSRSPPATPPESRGPREEDAGARRRRGSLSGQDGEEQQRPSRPRPGGVHRPDEGGKVSEDDTRGDWRRSSKRVEGEAKAGDENENSLQQRSSGRRHGAAQGAKAAPAPPRRQQRGTPQPSGRASIGRVLARKSHDGGSGIREGWAAGEEDRARKGPRRPSPTPNVAPVAGALARRGVAVESDLVHAEKALEDEFSDDEVDVLQEMLRAEDAAGPGADRAAGTPLESGPRRDSTSEDERGGAADESRQEGRQRIVRDVVASEGKQQEQQRGAAGRGPPEAGGTGSDDEDWDKDMESSDDEAAGAEEKRPSAETAAAAPRPVGRNAGVRVDQDFVTADWDEDDE